MPHFTIEYSANLDGRLDMGASAAIDTLASGPLCLRAAHDVGPSGRERTLFAHSPPPHGEVLAAHHAGRESSDRRPASLEPRTTQLANSRCRV